MKQNATADYQSYRDLQIEANERKFHRVWACPREMAVVAQLVRRHAGPPAFGLCHGARNGQEVRLLRFEFGGDTEILGTDISPTAESVRDMVQWDFHDENPAWNGRADFIYSNSWDHTYDIDKLAAAWAATLRPGGVAVVEWTIHHDEQGTGVYDCFGCSEDELAAAFTRAGLTEVERARMPGGFNTAKPAVRVALRDGAADPLADGRQTEYIGADCELVLLTFRRAA
ncbi:MAG: hypothetical protein AAGI17_08280 [Planctomycetota bacterium]